MLKKKQMLSTFKKQINECMMEIAETDVNNSYSSRFSFLSDEILEIIFFFFFNFQLINFIQYKTSQNFVKQLKAQLLPEYDQPRTMSNLEMDQSTTFDENHEKSKFASMVTPDHEIKAGEAAESPRRHAQSPKRKKKIFDLAKIVKFKKTKLALSKRLGYHLYLKILENVDYGTYRLISAQTGGGKFESSVEDNYLDTAYLFESQDNAVAHVTENRPNVINPEEIQPKISEFDLQSQNEQMPGNEPIKRRRKVRRKKRAQDGASPAPKSVGKFSRANSGKRGKMKSKSSRNTPTIAGIKALKQRMVKTQQEYARELEEAREEMRHQEEIKSKLKDKKMSYFVFKKIQMEFKLKFRFNFDKYVMKTIILTILDYFDGKTAVFDHWVRLYREDQYGRVI